MFENGEGVEKEEGNVRCDEGGRARYGGQMARDRTSCECMRFEMERTQRDVLRCRVDAFLSEFVTLT